MLSILEKSKSSSTLSVDEARNAVIDIENYICNNRADIPPYFLKVAQDEVKRLEAIIHQPVGFKFKKKTDTSSKKDGEDVHSPCASVEPESVHVDTASFGFQNKTDENLSLSADQVDCKDISLVNLKNCSIEVRGCTNSVYIKDLVSCRVKIGLASRAILLANCSNCEFTLICQQLRIDSSNDCTFELYVSSRAMLESSQGLSFRKLRWTFEGLDELFNKTNFELDKNNWKLIDDFDWLSKDIESKNFKILE